MNNDVSIFLINKLATLTFVKLRTLGMIKRKLIKEV